MLTAAIAVPLGVAAAVHLEEHGGHGRMSRFIEINIANLAGVPSIIYGLLGLGLFVRGMHMGQSVLAGASTLALLVLPVVILSTREALEGRAQLAARGSHALGATKWQTIWHQVLLRRTAGDPDRPHPGAVARHRRDGSARHDWRADVCAVRPRRHLVPVHRAADSDSCWVSRPQAAFAENAAAGILILLVLLLFMNGTAIALRDRLQRRGQ